MDYDAMEAIEQAEYAAEKAEERIRLSTLQEVEKFVEGKKIHDKGKMVVEFGDGTKHETFIDSDRAVFHNAALQAILTHIQEMKGEL